MPDIIIPLTFDDLPVKPPLIGRPRISDDIQQTAALLVGWDNRTRRLIRCSPTGVIRVGSARAKGIIDVLSDQATYTLTLPDIPTSEAMIRAYPDNSGRVFVNIGTAAALNTGYPLFTGEWVSVSVNNLNSLQLYIEKDAEKVAVIYTE